MLRLMLAPNAEPETGWVEVATPLGASAHVQINSPAYEICEDWRLLSTGRMWLGDEAAFKHWFGPLCEEAPIGVAAELLIANGMIDSFTALVAAEKEARAHILGLPVHCPALDREQRELLELALDLARRIEAGIAARVAAQEALSD